jgi:hypothetical protein
MVVVVVARGVTVGKMGKESIPDGTLMRRVVGAPAAPAVMERGDLEARVRMEILRAEAVEEHEAAANSEVMDRTAECSYSTLQIFTPPVS